MSEVPTAQTDGSQRPVPGQPGGTAPSPDEGKRSRRKILTPLVLAVLGLALLVAAFVLYPRTTNPSVPASTRLVVVSTAPLLSIGYAVDQVHPGIYRLEVRLTLAGNPPPNLASAGLTVAPPAGTTLLNCASPTCNGHQWTVGLHFAFHGRATAYFLVKASHFGVASNGVTASAAIPEILFPSGKGTPTLITAYTIPSASSYDWSSYPTSSLTQSFAAWDEAVAPGDTAGRVASGINHAAQANDELRIFFAGALLGLGGGAVLSAVQEALHARD